MIQAEGMAGFMHKSVPAPGADGGRDQVVGAVVVGGVEPGGTRAGIGSRIIGVRVADIGRGVLVFDRGGGAIGCVRDRGDDQIVPQPDRERGGGLLGRGEGGETGRLAIRKPTGIGGKPERPSSSRPVIAAVKLTDDLLVRPDSLRHTAQSLVCTTDDSPEQMIEMLRAVADCRLQSHSGRAATISNTGG